jgi:hypothetical protein
LILAALSLAALGACGTLDDLEEGADPIVYEDTEADSKADRPDIPFRVLRDFPVPSEVGQTETRRLFKSAYSFERTFGRRAPVDFATHWVVYYSAGIKPTGGYRAAISRIRLSGPGATLKITTHLESPGAGCAVTEALTKPQVLAAFAKPRPTPRYTRYYRADVVRDCGSTCATVRCAAGTFCDETTGWARCVAYSTCANAEIACAPGTHCEDVPIVCVTTPCAPTAPTCVADRCPAAYAPAARELAGTFANEDRNNEAALYPRHYEMRADGTFLLHDLISPCPQGAYCVWSGIVTRSGNWAVSADRVTFSYTGSGTSNWNLVYHPSVRVTKDCRGAVVLVEDRADGTTREFRR